MIDIERARWHGREVNEGVNDGFESSDYNCFDHTLAS
jgi:hypothetical protein